MIAAKHEPRLFDRMRQAIRARHYSIRTEEKPSGDLEVALDRPKLGRDAATQSFARVGKWPMAEIRRLSALWRLSARRNRWP